MGTPTSPTREFSIGFPKEPSAFVPFQLYRTACPAPATPDQGGTRMSEGIIPPLVDAFKNRRRSRNPKTDPLRLCRQAVLRSRDPLLKGKTVQAFAKEAVKHFVDGDPRACRRFYDGAFCFGDKLLIRTELLRQCVEAAVTELGRGNQQVVWRLLDLAMAHPPNDISPEAVYERFASAGVDVSHFDPPQPEEPHFRLHSLRCALPALVAA